MIRLAYRYVCDHPLCMKHTELVVRTVKFPGFPARVDVPLEAGWRQDRNTGAVSCPQHAGLNDSTQTPTLDSERPREEGSD